MPKNYAKLRQKLTKSKRKKHYLMGFLATEKLKEKKGK
jgi:hypothetical protein